MSRTFRDWRQRVSLVAVLAYCHGCVFYRTSASEVRTHCWRHDDAHPSCRISLSKQVYYCDPCGRGGNALDVLTAYLGSWPAATVFLRDVEPYLPPVQILASDQRHVRRRLNETASLDSASGLYPYFDARYRLQFAKRRDAGKRFSLWHPDGCGQLLPGMGGAQFLLYGLPILAELRPTYVIVVEGEKDAERAWSVNLPATTNPEGAGPGKWRARYTRTLARLGVRRAYVIPDNDPVGIAHAAEVVGKCRTAGLGAWMVSLPGLPPRGDLSDFLDAGGTPEQVVRLLNRARRRGEA